MRGRFLLVLVEPLPITGNTLVAEPLADLRRELRAGGCDQPAAGVGLQNQPGQAVAAAVDEADGVGFRSEQAGAFGDGFLEEIDHEGEGG